MVKTVRQPLFGARICVCMVCLVVCGPMGMAGETAADSPKNLLANGDFEKWTDGKPDHWVAAEAYKATPSGDGEGHGGRGRAAVLETSNATKSFFYQYPQVPFQDGQCVRFSVWLRLHEKSQPGGTMIQVGSTDGPPPRSALLGSNQLTVKTVKGEYRKFSVVHRLVPGGKFFYAAIVTDAPRKFYADNAVMEFTDEPPTRWSARCSGKT